MVDVGKGLRFLNMVKRLLGLQGCAVEGSMKAQ